MMAAACLAERGELRAKPESRRVGRVRRWRAVHVRFRRRPCLGAPTAVLRWRHAIGRQTLPSDSGTTFAGLGEQCFANADTPLEVGDVLAD
jgi:hypothetical protein